MERLPLELLNGRKLFLDRDIILNEVNDLEYFLDEIEETTDYNLWYCSHYHTIKKIDKIVFIFHKI